MLTWKILSTICSNLCTMATKSWSFAAVHYQHLARSMAVEILYDDRNLKRFKALLAFN